MSQEENMKIVNYEKYCKTCKNEKESPDSDVCNECLSEPARHYTSKPLKWEEK